MQQMSLKSWPIAFTHPLIGTRGRGTQAMSGCGPRWCSKRRCRSIGCAPMRRGGYAWVVAGLVAASAGLGGCTLRSSGADVVQGKKDFVAHCGTCHTLARAGSKGTAGPNLDEAFRRSRMDGIKSSTFMGVVERQIENPNTNQEIDPQTGKPTTTMPANIVKGEAARNVAAYVAQAAAVPGKDAGRLASVGEQKAQGTAKEANGRLDLPVAAAGLAFKFA